MQFFDQFRGPVPLDPWMVTLITVWAVIAVIVLVRMRWVANDTGSERKHTGSKVFVFVIIIGAISALQVVPVVKAVTGIVGALTGSFGQATAIVLCLVGIGYNAYKYFKTDPTQVEGAPPDKKWHYNHAILSALFILVLAGQIPVIDQGVAIATDVLNISGHMLISAAHTVGNAGVNI